LAKCGVCGSSYVKISANLFGCAAARDRGTCANRLNIRTETLENTILDLLKTRLMEPQLFKAFCEEFHREVNRLRIDESSTLEAQRTALDKVKRRTGKLIELITEGDAPVQAMKAELRTLEAKQAELENIFASAQAPAPPIHPALAEVWPAPMSVSTRAASLSVSVSPIWTILCGTTTIADGETSSSVGFCSSPMRRSVQKSTSDGG
jgi:hypothetical protein